MQLPIKCVIHVINLFLKILTEPWLYVQGFSTPCWQPWQRILQGRPHIVRARVGLWDISADFLPRTFVDEYMIYQNIITSIPRKIEEKQLLIWSMSELLGHLCYLNELFLFVQNQHKWALGWNSNRRLPFIVCRPRKTNFHFPFRLQQTNGKLLLPFFVYSKQTKLPFSVSSIFRLRNSGNMDMEIET